MKVPLRFQITEFDCGTVALTNAISYLFEREEIPAELIRAISTYTLDCYDEKGNLGNGGTSREAINYLTSWITNYAENNHFGIKCKRLSQQEVTISKIKECIKNGGVVFIRVWQTCQHYVILTGIDDCNAYIFDSYYFDEGYYDKDKEITMVFDKPFTFNRIVSLKRFESISNKDFAMGKISMRDCVLISRSE